VPAVRDPSLRRALPGPGPKLTHGRGRFFLAAAAALGGAWLVALGAAAQPASREARLGFVGDTGTGDAAQKAVAAQMMAWRPSQVFLLGDNIYDRGSRKYIASRFDNVYAGLMRAGTKFHAALGNHDVLWCEVPEIESLPDDSRAYSSGLLPCDVRHQLGHASFGYVGGRRYYSVKSDATAQPLVEVFVLDSNTLAVSQTKLGPLREDRAQLRWLDEALAASTARWKVVALHHPPHTPKTPVRYWWIVPAGGGRAREWRLDLQLGPILRRRGVDVVFAGHNHFYARMVPQNGIRYFVSGGGGREIYPFEEAPGYVAAGGDFHHFVYVRATDATFEYYAVDDAGRSRDAGLFTKGSAVDAAIPARSEPPSAPAGSP
jgi:3',5'-cyclic AMP phosphodiesterase CpdA